MLEQNVRCDVPSDERRPGLITLHSYRGTHKFSKLGVVLNGVRVVTRYGCYLCVTVCPPGSAQVMVQHEIVHR